MRMSVSFPRHASILLLALLGGACGATNVQVYEGEKMSPDQVTVLYSNPHLSVSVDRQYTVPSQKLHRLELPAGHHAVEVQCLYTDDVQYHPARGRNKRNVDPSIAGQKFTASPSFALVVEGQAGHKYKPRAHFEKDDAGVPGCHVKMFDITDESGGEKVHLY
jgi:hypothetical protein